MDIQNNAYVFISYSSQNQEMAQYVRQSLASLGKGLAVWMAPNSIPPGSDYMAQIPQAIANCTAFVLLITRESQASYWVRCELSTAISENRPVIPLLMDDHPLEEAFRFALKNAQIFSSSGNWDAGCMEILNQIDRIVSGTAFPQLDMPTSQQWSAPPLSITSIQNAGYLGLIEKNYANKEYHQALAMAQVAVMAPDAPLRLYEIMAMCLLYTAEEETRSQVALQALDTMKSRFPESRECHFLYATICIRHLPEYDPSIVEEALRWLHCYDGEPKSDAAALEMEYHLCWGNSPKAVEAAEDYLNSVEDDQEFRETAADLLVQYANVRFRHLISEKQGYFKTREDLGNWLLLVEQALVFFPDQATQDQYDKFCKLTKRTFNYCSIPGLALYTGGIVLLFQNQMFLWACLLLGFTLLLILMSIMPRWAMEHRTATDHFPDQYALIHGICSLPLTLIVFVLTLIWAILSGLFGFPSQDEP